MGPLGSPGPGQFQTGAPGLKNYPSLGVGSSYQHICFTMQQLCEAESKKDTQGDASTYNKLTKLKKVPRAPLHEDPSGVHKARDFGHGRTRVLGRILVSPK